MFSPGFVRVSCLQVGSVLPELPSLDSATFGSSSAVKMVKRGTDMRGSTSTRTSSSDSSSILPLPSSNYSAIPLSLPAAATVATTRMTTITIT